MVSRYKKEDQSRAVSRMEALQGLHLTNKESAKELMVLKQTIGDTLGCRRVVIALLDDADHHTHEHYRIGREYSLDELGLRDLVINAKSAFIISDVTSDPRFVDRSVEVDGFQVRFMAVCPFKDAFGETLGALCAFDDKLRPESDDEAERFRCLGRLVEMLLRSKYCLRAAEVALKEAEQSRTRAYRWGEMLEHVGKVSGVGGWQYEVETGLVLLTDRTRQIFGYDSDAAPTLADVISHYVPESHAYIERTLNESIANGSSWEFELPFRSRRGGDYIWVSVAGYPILQAGEVVRLVGSFEDVTQMRAEASRLELNEALARERSNELQVILARMSQGVSVYDARRRLKMWNDQYLNIYHDIAGGIEIGLSMEKVFELGTRTKDRCREVFLKLEDDIWAAIASGESFSSEAVLPDGKIVSMVATPLPDGGLVATHEDVTEQVKTQERIAFAANHDTLTKLANRTLFNKRLTDLLKWVRDGETSQQHFLLLLDLDKFKQVNDTHGHTVGDQVLQQVARRFGSAVRDDDLVARLGGDEFAILLSGDGYVLERVEELAARLVSSLSDPFVIGDLLIEVGLSVGVAVLLPQDETTNDVVNRADEALYEVKRQGRNGYRVAEGRSRGIGPDLNPGPAKSTSDVVLDRSLAFKDKRQAS